MTIQRSGPAKLSRAQINRLNAAPDRWRKMPAFGDQRSIQPLMRLGLIEIKEKDITPPDWDRSIAIMIDRRWRKTAAGRGAIVNASSGAA